jgi:DNA-binding FadR family transcriptional regulator
MAFHAAIHDASGNPMFGSILRRLDEMFERSRESPFSRSAFGLASFPFHRDLCDRIVAGDADGAARASDAILDAVEQEVRGIIAAGREDAHA